jgi:hypothetical protein
MAKPNYNHARRQREALRKARQDARLARRQSKPDTDTDTDAAEPKPAEDSTLAETVVPEPVK